MKEIKVKGFDEINKVIRQIFNLEVEGILRLKSNRVTVNSKGNFFMNQDLSQDNLIVLESKNGEALIRFLDEIHKVTLDSVLNFKKMDDYFTVKIPSFNNEFEFDFNDEEYDFEYFEAELQYDLLYDLMAYSSCRYKGKMTDSEVANVIEKIIKKDSDESLLFKCSISEFIHEDFKPAIEERIKELKDLKPKTSLEDLSKEEEIFCSEIKTEYLGSNTNGFSLRDFANPHDKEEMARIDKLITSLEDKDLLCFDHGCSMFSFTPRFEELFLNK